MTWRMSKWVWVLRSPLHLGAGPSGALNRTRLYIPSSTIWGAVTAVLTRMQFPSATSQEYQKVGHAVREHLRFSYLFPAVYENNQWNTWLPRYTHAGLQWERENGKRLSDRAFRRSLLGSLPGTAIDPSTDTAAEGTLRETEVILPYWRINASHPGESVQRIAFVGYVFWKDAQLFQKVQQIQEIFVGGDTRYGLGQMRIASLSHNLSSFWGRKVDLRSLASPRVRTSTVLAHALPDRINLKGDRELLQGWDWNSGARIVGLLWKPGSFLENGEAWFELTPDGVWAGSEDSLH